MNLKLSSITLVPKREDLKNRTILFNIDNVNILTGASAKGKSAVTYIIDYCFGSSKCRIPIGLIRETTKWFAITILVNDKEILIARKEPSLSRTDMYLQSGKNLGIDHDTESNMKVHDVIAYLNNITKLPDLTFEESTNQEGYSGKLSIRDIVSLIYQPQNIVANSNTLFYRTEKFQYRERLRKIFPYILGITDDKVLLARERLKNLSNQKKRVENRIKKYNKSKEEWLSTLRGYYTLAIEYNLLDSKAFEPSIDNLDKVYNELQSALEYLDKKEGQLPIIEKGVTKKIANRIARLIEEQDMISSSILEKKSKLVALKKLITSNSRYFNSISDQNNRVQTIDWFLAKISDSNCFLCGNETNSKDYLLAIDEVEEDLKIIKNRTSDFIRVSNREISKIEGSLNEDENDLIDIRNEINNLNVQNDSVKRRSQSIRRIFSFLGELNEVLSNYERQFEANNDSNELEGIEKEIKREEKIISQSNLRNRKEVVLNKISNLINKYATLLNGERLDDKVSLNFKDLDLVFTSTKGDENYLWEIGSGHNYLVYHIATFLSLHEYLYTYDNSVIPAVLIIDQPSQVYFPEVEDDTNVNDGDDIKKVRNLFKTLSEFNNSTNGNVQIIVLEHVGKSVYGEFKNIHLVERWRKGEPNQALIPDEWIS